MLSYIRKTRNRDMENIVVVYPYTYINPYFILPPIAAEYLQAGIHAAGKQARLFDMRFESNIDAWLQQADMVCLYGYFEDCSIFGKWKKHCINEILAAIPSEVPVIAGGTGFSKPEETFEQYPDIDVIIRGNPETPIQDILSGKDIESVPNLSFLKDDKVFFTPRVIHPLPEDIFPRRKLRDPKYDYHVAGIKTDLIRAGVGCNYTCKFCYQYGKDLDGKYRKWQGRSAKSIFKEMHEIDGDIVGWVDDDMTTSMKTLEELADLLIKHNVKKLYAGTGRIDHVLQSNVDVLKKLEKSGLLALSFGVESLKQETLDFYGKKQSLEDIEKAMAMVNQTNILLICNFILGSPKETEEDMMNMLWFGRRWNVDTLVTNRLSVPENSTLYRIMYDKSGLPRTGAERIHGKELSRIKNKIKFGQRTPFRICLSILKLYRHKGMYIDPMQLFLSAVLTMTRHTWLEKSLVFPYALRGAIRVLRLAPVRSFNRGAAIILTPGIKAINAVFEHADKRLGISTSVLPRFVLFLKEGMYRKQVDRAQINTSARRP